MGAKRIEAEQLPVMRQLLMASLRSDGRPRRGTPIEVRLWGQCVVTESGCWEFSGMKSDGYGVIHFRRLNMKAHRVAWILSHGDLGDLWVLHRCDNRPCCNPSHLFIGDCADNNRDRHAKGRSRSLFSTGHKVNQGSRCGKAKLSESDIPVIRDLIRTGASQRVIADLYGVHNSQISRIKSGRFWSHVANS